MQSLRVLQVVHPILCRATMFLHSAKDVELIRPVCASCE